MQLQDIRTKARQSAGIDDADAMAADTLVDSMVNQAIRQVSSLRDWDWLYSSETINSVNGTAAYTPAADWRTTVRVVDDADGGMLKRISPDASARYTRRLTLRPLFWYVEGGDLYLSPPPTTARAYTHTYIKTETTLSNDTDEPDIPDWAIDLVIIKVALKLAARMDNTSQFRLLQAEERETMKALEGEARRARGAQPVNSRRDWRMR